MGEAEREAEFQRLEDVVGVDPVRAETEPYTGLNSRDPGVALQRLVL